MVYESEVKRDKRLYPITAWLPTSVWDNDMHTFVVIGTQPDPMLVTAVQPTMRNGA